MVEGLGLGGVGFRPYRVPLWLLRGLGFIGFRVAGLRSRVRDLDLTHQIQVYRNRII